MTNVDRFLVLLRVALIGLIVVGLLAFVAQQVDPNNPFARWANPDATGLTGAQFKGLLVTGLSQGAMYGLIALGYSMVYGVLGFINFAHGEAKRELSAIFLFANDFPADTDNVGLMRFMVALKVFVVMLAVVARHQNVDLLSS